MTDDFGLPDPRNSDAPANGKAFDEVEILV
jgi:hypothetical protein